MTQEFFAPTQSHSLPPQNVDAEESILGGILQDPEAIGRVADLLRPEAFYVSAHRDIYQAAFELYRQGKPTDLTTVASWLSDRALLEKIGGTNKLVQLVAPTVSAVNIDRYALLVEEKYQRRELIKAGNEIVDLAYNTAKELNTVFDESEQKIFSLTQQRPQQGLTSLADTLRDTFNEIEALQEQTKLPGITCGFYDLDAMTSGFGRSDLIIIAGRPSMGKTALGLGMAANIAKQHGLSVAIFSLEMSKEQLSQRLLASEARIEGNRLRSGRISQTEMEALVNALGMLSDLPIFIDDTANLSVMQMRSEARRLQAEQGGNLGLVLIDYLQLMEGSGSDNRVQELSKITRSLKGLSRELNVPVIALSQLSRGVEQRTNKRPMMSDLRESGCLSGDTLVTLADTGVEVPIRDLEGKSGFAVWALNVATMKLEKAIVSNSFATGIKPVFKLKTRLGREISATCNHQFLTINGWGRLDSLKVGECIALPLSIANFRTSLYKNNLSRIKAGKLAEVVKSEKITCLADSDIYWDEIVAIEADGEAKVYDLTVPSLHNFIANNLVVHNSIEQDADLIVMLYRDSYYNPDSPDRNIAEAIITKHRNGPTGTVKLLFLPELTKFDNLAPQGGY
ncbi:replicative DNA helicase [Oscillatoria salina]|uniref:replicative DNA helicase n=1 Tax=Oscillatoria salina TaxID=331517 RepID=UPI001CCE94F4|nr:replicative DNA helicase [Oscillatoria salina]MBZ8180784.1 replicative DNA helicase [Oscillatoria salina IIICB1]